MNFWQDLYENFTWANMVFGVSAGLIANLLTRVIDYLFKKTPQVEGSIPRYNLEVIGETVGCLLGVVAVYLFIVIYIFKIEIDLGDSIGNFITIRSLTVLFIIGFGLFFLFYVIQSVREIFKRQISVTNFIHRTSALVIITTMVLCLVLYVKMAVEVGQGMSSEEIETVNQIFRPYWIILFHVFLAATGIRIVGMIVQFIEAKITKYDNS